MTRTTILVTQLFLMTSLAFSQDWVTTDISNVATLDFPVESVLYETNGEFVYTANDENALYTATTMKHESFVSSILTEDEIPNYYKGMIDGIVKASNAKLVSKKEITINGIKAFEIEYISASNPELPSHRFGRIVYAKPYLFKIGFWPHNNSDQTDKIKAQFFNSLTLNLDEIKKSQQSMESETGAESFATKMGAFVGEILAYVTFLIIILVIVFLIWFFIKKLKKKKPNANNTSQQKQMKTMTIVCNKCETENKSNSKYCKQCGFEL